MKKIVALVAMVLLAASSFAQSKASLKGVLIDSVNKEKLEFATIAAVNAKDTTLISYTITQKDGTFKLTGIPTDKETKLIISYAGYKTVRIPLKLQPGVLNDLGQIIIAGLTLREINVRGERTPVVVNKDTISFNTEAFKTRPNAMIEEMLMLFPGVQVDVNGNISYNGKPVNKLLIEGKRFFGTDPKVATKNLYADMVAQVQVYDDREDDPDHKLTDNEVGKIMNLKLKSAIKKATMGTAYAGGGSRDRYEVGGVLSTFRDTLQVSLIGLANNLNRTGFNFNDLYTMGGFNRSGLTSSATNYLRGGSGIERMISTGLNINNDYGKRLKTNLSYFYTNINRDNNTQSFTEQSLSNTVLSTANTSAVNTYQQGHAITGLIESVPDTTKRIRYQPRINFNPTRQTTNGFSNAFNTQTPKINDIVNNSSSRPYDNTFAHTFSYYTKLGKKGKSLNIVHNLSLGTSGADSYNFYNLTSYTSALPSQVYDRYADNDKQYNLFSLQATYNHPVNKKVTADVMVYSRYILSYDHVTTFDKNPTTGAYDQFLASQSTKLDRITFVQNFKPQLTFQVSKNGRIRAGVDFETQYLKNKFNANIPDFGKEYYYLFPVFNYSAGGFSVDYYEFINQTDISQVQPITREYSQLYKTIGNPDLAPNRSYNLAVRYNKYITDKLMYLNLNAKAEIVANAIVAKNTIDNVGATTLTYVNRDGSLNLSADATVDKQFKKSQKLQISVYDNVGLSHYRSTFFLNADEGRQLNYGLYFRQGFTFNYISSIYLNSSYNFNANITKYSGLNYNTINTIRHGLSSTLRVTQPAHMVFNIIYNYSYNTQVAPGFPKSANLLNVEVSRLILKKDRGQIKLSAYDILDQNISVNRYASANSITTNELQVLRRYFLLTLQYRITTTKK